MESKADKRRVRQSARASMFSSTWLPIPWSLPVVGYLAAVGLPIVTILLTWLLLRALPTFALQGTLPLLAILVVALLWGTGPGLVATLIGALLFNVVILPPLFSWNFSLLQPVLETILFLVAGVAISLIVSRIEYARSQVTREKVHAASQARELEAILATIADAVYVYDADRRVKRTNPAAEAFNPFTRQEDYQAGSFPDRFASFLPQDEAGRPFSLDTMPVMRVLRGEVLTAEQAVDVRMRTVEGEDRLYSVSGAPIRDEVGRIQGAVIVTRDVTERGRIARRTREALQALLQFAEAVVQAGVPEAGEGVAGIDQVVKRLASLISQVLGYQGVGITAFKEGTQRPVATAAHGLTPEQERGWRERRGGFTIHELVAKTPVERSLQAGEAVVIDLSSPPFSAHPTIYGPRKVLLVPMALEGRSTGVVTYIAGDASQDYPEEEVALARALAQLAALTLERTRLFQERTQAQATVLALRETNRLMDEFIGIAGHELRTPLTTIKGSVALARKQALKILKDQEHVPAEVTAVMTTMLGHLDRTERQIRMQNRLIGDLLDVARIHTNRLELHPEVCDLLALVRESVEDQQYLARARTITLTSGACEEVLVMADADRVQQVISNYLSNALKYSQADKPVEVHLDLTGPQVRVAVRDEGPGLSEEQQQRVWERFYRAPEVEVKSGSGIGLGLGLHISRMIIERLDGQVGIESMPGHGSVFWFTLPLAEVGERE